ncbi:MAG: hypothetical protein GY835_02950 [bacterium]|nr:hypothetical protein [bacterium]
MRRLVEAGEVDDYLLFTNRRLGGEAESKIIRELREETDIPNLAILGLEKIIEFLVAHPKIVRHCGIDLFRAPLRFHAEDIKRVILAFHHQKTTNRLANVLKKFTYREMEEKNEINQLQKEYFDVIKSGSEAYFKQISTFLGDPINAALAEIYGDFATEINHKIELRRNDFAHFAEVFEFLYDEVTAAEPKLRPRELIWVFLHFMYFNCDLGRT